MIPDYVIQDLTPESYLESFKCAEGDLNDYALASATGFYQAKGNFRFFTEQDKDDDTRLMYFDLKDFG